jgi:hypothetical protein
MPLVAAFLGFKTGLYWRERGCTGENGAVLERTWLWLWLCVVAVDVYYFSCPIVVR